MIKVKYKQTYLQRLRVRGVKAAQETFTLSERVRFLSHPL